jgi:hypothetical protein
MHTEYMFHILAIRTEDQQVAFDKVAGFGSSPETSQKRINVIARTQLLTHLPPVVMRPDDSHRNVHAVTSDDGFESAASAIDWTTKERGAAFVLHAEWFVIATPRVGS